MKEISSSETVGLAVGWFDGRVDLWDVPRRRLLRVLTDGENLAQGRVVPDSFTHGSSAQRTRWFRIGLDSGDYRKCDTFRAQQL